MFFDGTFWSSDELIARSASARKRAEEMAHWPIGGPSGSLAQLAVCGAARRVYIHINNTNPILREDRPERAAVVAAGWEIAARRHGAGAVSASAERCRCGATSSSRGCARGRRAATTTTIRSTG